MKRNNIFKSPGQDKLIEHKQCIAFHEAGHATAIYLNNKARNLPPVFFQIIFKDLNSESKSEEDPMVYYAMHKDCMARVDGGRLIQSLPYSINALMHKTVGRNDAMALLLNDYMIAFEADIINLLIGPLAEAKYIAETDGERLNHRLVNLEALRNYGGGSDIKLINDYLHSYSSCKKQHGEKLDELFIMAFNFLDDRANWTAITRLANYILDSDKNMISCTEVASLLEL